MAASILEKYLDMKASNILVQYTGRLSTDELVLLGESIRGMKFDGYPTRNIFAVFIELGQNLIEHGPGYHELALYKDDAVIKLCSLNELPNHRVKDLHERINYLNRLDIGQLRHKKKERSRMPWETPGPSAGLGLYDIRIRTGNNLVINLFPKTDNSQYCILQALFMKNNERS